MPVVSSKQNLKFPLHIYVQYVPDKQLGQAIAFPWQTSEPKDSQAYQQLASDGSSRYRGGRECRSHGGLR